MCTGVQVAYKLNVLHNHTNRKLVFSYFTNNCNVWLRNSEIKLSNHTVKYHYQ